MSCARRSAACSATWSTLRAAQAARGHRVGLIADAATGGAQAETTLAALAARAGARAQPGRHEPADRAARRRRGRARRAARRRGRAPMSCTATAPRAAPMRGSRRRRRRSASTRRTAAACTTDWGSPTGCLYLALERVLMRRTDLFLFESAYGRDVFRAKIGDPGAPGARRAQRRHRSRIHPGRSPIRRPPISCSSANCARSRASTC